MKPLIIYFKVIFIFFLLGLTQSNGQLAPSQEIYIQHFQEADLLYQKHLFGSAQSEMIRFLSKEPYRSIDEDFWAKAQAYAQICALKNENKNAEQALLKLVNEYNASPYGNLVNQEIADFYLAKEDYDQASFYYDEINFDILSQERYSELNFKNAYTKFVSKKFDQSKVLFEKVVPFKDKYFFPAHYYYGMAEYFTENLDGAIRHFKELEESNAYKKRIPYLITQLQFKKGEYDEVINYGSLKIKEPNVKNVKEIRGLIGQSYFTKDDFENAISHLSYYIDNTEKLRAEDFYQLGFAYYQTNQFDQAISQFLEIANEDSEIGQNANNYLAKSYVQNNNKNAALAAFKRTSELNHIEGLAEEAEFNFAKLSAELGYDREALDILRDVSPNSPYFAESQKVLSEILNNTKDYEKALNFIEGMEMQSPLIQETYQRIAYLYGMQFLVDQRFREAESYFLTSLKRPVNEEYTVLSHYRLAAIYNQDFNYGKSITYMSKFLSSAITSLPPDVNMGHANYIQGYNFLKTNEFGTARIYLSEAADTYRTLGQPKLQMDALLRAADCYFQINDYDNAGSLYTKAINLNRKGTDYALYQRGILEGLQGKPYEKLVTLDRLIDEYPRSSLAEFALFQSAETLLALNEPSEAQRSFKQILSDYPNSKLKTRSLLKLGLIAFNQGNNNDAIRYYKDVFNYNPNSAELQEAIIALEEIYVEQLSQPEEFFSFVKEKSGITISDFERDSLSYRAGKVPYEIGEYEKAIEAYTNYLSRFPDGFNLLEAHYKRGESYLNLRRYEEALNDYEVVLSKGVSDYYISSLHKSAVISFYQVKDFKKSFDYYSLLEEIEKDPELKYEAQIGAMRSAMKIQDTEALQYMSEKVLENELRKEEDVLAAQYNLSTIYFEQKEYDKAIPLMNKVIAAGLSEQAAEVHYMQSYIAFERNSLDDADARIRQFIIDYKSYPNWVAKNLILLSDVLVKKEDLLQAKAALEAVIENYSGDEEIRKTANERLQIIKKLEEEKNRIEEQSNTNELILEKENDGQNE